MILLEKHSVATADEQRRRGGEQAFTMVEIALSIAIVAFALVAIIGVLPTGLQVQRDNREETIINQDGTYLMEAIRGGSLGLDELTNFVERITITSRSKNGIIRYVDKAFPLTSGHFIIGMLSTPTYQIINRGNGRPPEWATNEVTALMRSISGSAAQRFQQPEFRENTFTYLVTSTIAPYMPMATNLPPGEPGLADSNRLFAARNTMSNLHDIRLHFRWPVNVFEQSKNVRYQTGKREKVFRSLISGRLMRTNGFLYYFQPSIFAPPAR